MASLIDRETFPECPVCLEPLENKVSITGCHHLIHVRCINDWEQACYKKLLIPTCPTCRNPDWCSELITTYPILEGAALHEAIEKIGIQAVKILLICPFEALEEYQKSMDNSVTGEVSKTIRNQRKAYVDLIEVIQTIDETFRINMGWWFMHNDLVPDHNDLVPDIDNLNRRLGYYRDRFRWKPDLILSNLNITNFPAIDFHIFRHLKLVDLSNNHLTQLPSGIEKLELLAILILKKNKLTHLPPTIGLLNNLEIIDLECNQLEELPDEIKHCHKLKIIILTNNLTNKLTNRIV